MKFGLLQDSTAIACDRRTVGLRVGWNGVTASPATVPHAGDVERNRDDRAWDADHVGEQ